MQQVDSFHYPPELFQLLVNTIPLLNRSKDSVILFFRGAGVPEILYKDLSNKINTDRDSINKYEICRTILTRLNEKKELYIKERRELLKRIVEFESFTNCWENDQYKAKGLVAEIQKIINVKDSFTRMNQEREKEHLKHTTEYNDKIKKIQERTEQIDSVKKKLYALFAMNNPQERGKSFEEVLNLLFSIYGIIVREAFTRTGNNGEGIIEQIDGVIEIDNQIYLVEMKWTKQKIGNDDIFTHLGRIYLRSNAQGIFISASGYSSSGILSAKDALGKALLILTDLEEFIDVLENNKDLVQYLKTKIRNAIIDKDPYTKA